MRYSMAGYIILLVPVVITILIRLTDFLIHVSRAEPLKETIEGETTFSPKVASDNYTKLQEYEGNRSPERILWCGFPVFLGKKKFSLYQAIFPEVTIVLPYEKDTETKPDDVLFISSGGPCPYRPPELQDHFPGKILFLHGAVKPGSIPADDHERLYTLGPRSDSKHAIRTTYGAMHLASFPIDVQRTIYDPSLRPKNNGRYFLLYLASHCVPFREIAFHQLANIGTVHYGGSCKGRVVGRPIPNATRAPFRAKGKGEWAFNKDIFPDYRFALVMENSVGDGYISEKIINAFLGGAVPIWYGTREIFSIFNERAFVYYDVQDPQPALQRVAYLEHNHTAYTQILNEPILANGSQTISDYFSFQDSVGGGKLKWRIRAKMGYGN